MTSETPQTPFEKLLEEERADKLMQDLALKKQKGNKGRNQKFLFAGVGVATVLLVGAIVVYDPFTGALRFGDGVDQSEVKIPNENTTLKTPEWWQEPDNVSPVKLTDWQKDTFTEEKADELYSAIEKYYSGSDLENEASILPSEASGFTSDVSKEELEDKTLNTRFSYWTRELFIRETGAMLEALVNPQFGAWKADGDEGRLTDVTYKALSRWFSKPWLETHPNASDLPVFTGAGAEIDYLPAGAGRWIGQLTNVQTNFNYDESIRNYRVSLVADITYTTWNQAKEKVSKDAVLTLTLVPNQDVYGNDSNNHIVIDESQIEVKS